MKEIPVCVQYEVNGEKTDDFPFTAVIDEAKPVLTHHARLGLRHFRRAQV